MLFVKERFQYLLQLRKSQKSFLEKIYDQLLKFYLSNEQEAERMSNKYQFQISNFQCIWHLKFDIGYFFPLPTCYFSFLSPKARDRKKRRSETCLVLHLHLPVQSNAVVLRINNYIEVRLISISFQINAIVEEMNLAQAGPLLPTVICNCYRTGYRYKA